MRYPTKLFTAFLILVFTAALPAQAQQDLTGLDNNYALFSIESIFCSGGDCINNYETSVLGLKGVVSAKLNLEKHRFEVKFDETLTNESTLLERMKEVTELDLIMGTEIETKKDEN